MARRPKSGEPISQVETQREGIMCEGLHLAIGGIGCVSYIEYFASTNGKMSAMCCTSLERRRRSSPTAKLGNLATFPRTTFVSAMLVFYRAVYGCQLRGSSEFYGLRLFLHKLRGEASLCLSKVGR
jgi:hypothetical protein